MLHRPEEEKKTHGRESSSGGSVREKGRQSTQTAQAQERKRK